MMSLQEQIVQKVNSLSEDNLQFLSEMIERFMWTGSEEEKAEPDSNSNRYSGMLDDSNFKNEGNGVLTTKMKAFIELEEMLTPVSEELDYDKELAEAAFLCRYEKNHKPLCK